MRLDKFLSNAMIGSRREVTALIRSGVVTIDGTVVKDVAYKIDLQKNKIAVNNEIITYKEHYHLMLNKPKGIVTATEDKYDKTVLDLIDEKFPKDKLFPVGRLDKDTEGFVFLTTDGQLSHRITGPKKNINKVYFVTIDNQMEENFILQFMDGIVIDDGYQCKPAQLEIIDDSSCYLTISEGKFHQVKRMFQALGQEVTYLKRVKIGQVLLDKSLVLGDYRELTDEELLLIQK